MNLYVDRINIINMADLENYIADKLISLNATLNTILKINDVNDKKNFQCCLDKFKVELENAKNISGSKSNRCVITEKLNLASLVDSEVKKAKKHFTPCFYNDPRTKEIFGCMESHQSSRNAPSILKTTYNEAVNKFTESQQFLPDKIFNCSSEWRNYYHQQFNNSTNQFDICIRNLRPLETCIEPVTQYS
ncbi:uncharacterized protein LOC122853377 [Aphidius gifuensis]|uniref:uncharacterized protein LOC122853377 n=1 Tax=Aphidius gifuensis TaxID=684658 RepID=UPI001CDB9F23|nr:uncharacterized protein LOC122853377 [Aphidius gifuensis]